MLTFLAYDLRRRARYRCECGVEILAFVYNVTSGHTRSCGCLRRIVTAERSMTHGHKSGGHRSRAYASWVGMKSRCTNPNRPDYQNYGGRGITFDPAWSSFERFFADMGEPGQGETLDRIDNSQGYSEANCRWASWAIQNLNKRTCVRYTFNGKSQTLSEWARETGIGRVTILKRIQRGVPLELALTTKGFLKMPTNDASTGLLRIA